MEFTFGMVQLFFGIVLPILFVYTFIKKSAKSNETKKDPANEFSQRFLASRRVVASVLLGLPLLGLILGSNGSWGSLDEWDKLILYLCVSLLSLIVLAFRALTVTRGFSDVSLKERLRQPMFMGLFLFPVSALAGLLLALREMSRH